MYLTAGNLLTTKKVGLLFIDFEGRKRMRLNGIASVDDDDPLLAEFPEAQLIVRVRATEVFPNCPRYIHEYKLVKTIAVRAEDGVRDAGAAVEAERVGTRRPAGERSGERSVARGHPARVTQASGVSRRELLTRATALVAGATVLDRLPHALRLRAGSRTPTRPGRTSSRRR